MSDERIIPLGNRLSERERVIQGYAIVEHAKFCAMHDESIGTAQYWLRVGSVLLGQADPTTALSMDDLLDADVARICQLAGMQRERNMAQGNTAAAFLWEEIGHQAAIERLARERSVFNLRMLDPTENG